MQVGRTAAGLFSHLYKDGFFPVAVAPDARTAERPRCLGFTSIEGFICQECGEGVSVEPPVQ